LALRFLVHCFFKTFPVIGQFLPTLWPFHRSTDLARWFLSLGRFDA
jgi:hypothetical protein